MVWYFHRFQNFSPSVVTHTVKVFMIVNEAELDVFLETSCFFNDPVDWHFDLWFLCLFKIQLVHPEVLGSRIADASLKDFEHNLATM